MVDAAFSAGRRPPAVDPEHGYNSLMAAPLDADLQALTETVARKLAGAGTRLAVAESCTGGWVAKVCTDLPGSSRWFLGGVVAYADAAKAALLGVPVPMLAQSGAVSEPVVRAMAEGALDRFMADYSIAVTGVAGPDGGTPEKPVGTVWFAWARRGPGGETLVQSRREQLPGDRESVRRWTVYRALGGLLGQ
jgi:nicotinamide-nucleotide amidase